jgi:restriction endonuclease Mrr
MYHGRMSRPRCGICRRGKTAISGGSDQQRLTRKRFCEASVAHGRSRDASDYVSKIGSKIVLIDGSRLAELMIEFGVAVATDATYTVKRIDNDFFESI